MNFADLPIGRRFRFEFEAFGGRPFVQGKLLIKGDHDKCGPPDFSDLWILTHTHEFDQPVIPEPED